jgi:hypothetical protein
LFHPFGSFPAFAYGTGLEAPAGFATARLGMPEHLRPLMAARRREGSWRLLPAIALRARRTLSAILPGRVRGRRRSRLRGRGNGWDACAVIAWFSLRAWPSSCGYPVSPHGPLGRLSGLPPLRHTTAATLGRAKTARHRRTVAAGVQLEPDREVGSQSWCRNLGGVEE